VAATCSTFGLVISASARRGRPLGESGLAAEGVRLWRATTGDGDFDSGRAGGGMPFVSARELDMLCDFEPRRRRGGIAVDEPSSGECPSWITPVASSTRSSSMELKFRGPRRRVATGRKPKGGFVVCKARQRVCNLQARDTSGGSSFPQPRQCQVLQQDDNVKFTSGRQSSQRELVRFCCKRRTRSDLSRSRALHWRSLLFRRYSYGTALVLYAMD
jgi:hypothetical protein